MPTTSYKEPTKESQDTKPSVVKWGCEGPLLIYLVLPPAMKARALVEARCARLRGSMHGGGEGMHACGSRVYTLARERCAHLQAMHIHVGKACMHAGGTHGYWRVHTLAG